MYFFYKKSIHHVYWNKNDFQLGIRATRRSFNELLWIGFTWTLVGCPQCVAGLSLLYLSNHFWCEVLGYSFDSIHTTDCLVCFGDDDILGVSIDSLTRIVSVVLDNPFDQCFVMDRCLCSMPDNCSKIESTATEEWENQGGIKGYKSIYLPICMYIYW